MGPDAHEGVLVRWLKTEGSPVTPGEVIAEIETDKAIVEVEAPAAGSLVKLLAAEGATLPAGSALALIAAPDEALPNLETLQPPAPPPTGEERVPLNRMRSLIAARTSRSKREAPHFYVISEIDMTEAVRFRRELSETLPAGVRVSVNDMIIKACALAIKKHPIFNAYFHDYHLVHSPHVNIGVAVAVNQGLIIPAITDCQDRDLVNIAQTSKALIERAHGGALKPSEYTGCTFAISNLGMYDVDSFTAIIYPPNAAVLAVGSVKEKPAVKGGEITIARLMKATLSIDHRVIDGAGGAQFLHDVKKLLERPSSLL